MVDPRLDNVPGFGRCGECSFHTSGPASLCFACARRSVEALAAATDRCEVCDLAYEAGESNCRNWLCGNADRKFEWNYAIAMRSGALEQAINRYKFGGKMGWAMIFGRVLAGFLELEARIFREFDLILASPTFVGEGGRTFDHTGEVLRQAAEEVTPGRGWPFDVAPTPAIVKMTATRSLTGKTVVVRREIARSELQPALEVPDVARTRRKRVLVYDDVFTDGTTLNEVAQALLIKGEAQSVCGVSLCRQPWRGGGRS